MSWTGLKKAINRAGTQVLVKTGQMDQTVDKEFEFEEKRYRTMEISSNKLQKELRHYLESLRMLTNSQVNIGESLSTYYGALPSSLTPSLSNNHNNTQDPESAANAAPKEKFNSLSQEYYATMKTLGEQSLAELEHPYNQTVLNPIARFNSYYIEINEAIKKRANKQLDYDAMKSKVKKLIEKPPANGDYETKLANYQTELTELENVYQQINSQLKSEIPKLINLRIPFLDPSFEAFVKIQLRFFNENYSQLDTLQKKLDSRTREAATNGNLDKRLDDILGKMRELNITGA
ncbi:uncharacterized protein RJT21DRAFT_123126 [Scheffersomyces amazonensis]|uniref:uncharacterized protein n=1 Tax=Scheffersomyces amazonensis TaxID=1078765 RepID=UPI00315D69E9